MIEMEHSFKNKNSIKQDLIKSEELSSNKTKTLKLNAINLNHNEFIKNSSFGKVRIQPNRMQNLSNSPYKTKHGNKSSLKANDKPSTSVELNKSSQEVLPNNILVNDSCFQQLFYQKNFIPKEKKIGYAEIHSRARNKSKLLIIMFLYYCIYSTVGTKKI